MALYLIAILLMVAADQAAKFWVLAALKPIGTYPIIQDVFHLTYVENRGAAFSMFADQNGRWLFALLSVAVCGAILYFLAKGKVKTKIGRASLVMIAGGAIGNGIDRVLHGFVVDFFDARIINFAIFNVADIFITVGAALFAFYVIVQDREKKLADGGEGHSAD